MPVGMAIHVSDTFLSWPSLFSLTSFEVELAEELPKLLDDVFTSSFRIVLCRPVLVLLGLSLAAVLPTSWLDAPVLVDSATGEGETTVVVS